MTDFIKKYWTKYRELIVYVICGALTTAVDFGVYAVLTRMTDCGEVPAQIASTAAAIVFAFIVNKWIVFRNSDSGGKTLLAQFVSFASMRVVSGAFQTFVLWLFSVKLGLYDMAVKFFAAVIVVILNYAFSKLVIFKKK